MESEETNQNIFDNELDFEEEEVREDGDILEDFIFESIANVENDGENFENNQAEPSANEIAQHTSDLPATEKSIGVQNGDEISEEEEEEAIKESDSDGEISDSDENGEVPDKKVESKKEDDREEGECSDGDEAVELPPPNRPRIPCKFYNRGFCNWGMNCKFLHAGFNDKGNYRMFEPMKHPASAMSAMNCGVPMRRPAPPVSARPEPASAKQETAWERGLRQAKEMMRQAQQRKETDIDFEEKKMNLSLGEEDIYKENVLNTRPASPLFSRSDDEDEENFPNRPVNRVNYEMPMPRPPMERRIPYQGPRNFNGRGRGGGDQYYNNYNKGYRDRGQVGKYWENDRKRNEAPQKGRGDEWSDPWMRKRSPERRPRRRSKSSGSSYSSSSRSYSSSSRSSRSSYSSYSSRSRSRSKSRSRSRSKLSPIAKKEELYGKQGTNIKKPSAPVRLEKPKAKELPIKQVPLPPPAKAEPLRPEPKKPMDYNPSFQNPPAPEQEEDTTDPPPVQNKGEKKLTISPFGIHQSISRTIPGNTLKKAKKASKKSKKVKSKKKDESESDSDSSSSSSSSTSSSSTTTSESEDDSNKKSKSKKKIVMDGREALANIVKINAMDALRLSGQKQQIKLKLKPAEIATSSAEPVPVLATPITITELAVPTRKRSIDSAENDAASKAKKATSSRREELLTQLKAIEDAIKRKRSKLQ